MLPMDGLTREERSYLAMQTSGRQNKLIKGMQQATKQTAVPIRFRVLDSKLPNKSEILARLATHDANGKYENWVLASLKLPLGIYSSPPKKALSDITSWLSAAKDQMDRALYGQLAAKDECIRMLCLWAASGGAAKANWAIGLHGLPGIGKTCFAQNILSTVMQRPFTSISLAGVSDSSFLLGHSFTYEGATCGKIADAMKQWGVSDGILYFDELDKVSKARGDDISNMLVNLTDREQNGHFRDKYFSSIDLDLSRSIMAFSYNDDTHISPILMDRFNVIKFDPPSREDKVCIAKQHLIPRALNTAGLGAHDLTFDDEVIGVLIDRCTAEAGVRNLDKAIDRLVKTMLVVIKGSADALREVKLSKVELPLKVTEKLVESCIHKPATSNMTCSLMYC